MLKICMSFHSVPYFLICDRNVEGNHLIVLQTFLYEFIEGYDPEDDSSQLKMSISELFSRWKETYSALEVILRSFKKIILHLQKI
jgi:hypothetical protein